MQSKDNHSNGCKCWSCFIQENFTAVLFAVVLLISLAAVISLMHEASMNKDKLAWLEGLALTVMNLLALALKPSNAGQHQGDTLKTGDNTTVVQAPKTEPQAAPLENPATTQTAESKPDLPVFTERK